MRISRSLALLLSVAALCWSGCGPAGPVVEARWRFVGGDTLAAQTNAPTVREVLALPGSAALRGPLLTNATRLLWQLAGGSADAPAAVFADAQPLVADLLDRVSLGTTLKPGADRREFAIAVQADAARAQVWQAAWPKFIAAAQTARGGATGKPEVLFQGGWIVAVSDTGVLAPTAALKTLALIPAEPQGVLRIELNLPGQPAAVLSTTVRDGAVRSQLKLAFADALPAKLPAWERPAMILDPLAQFAAARGVAQWLGALPWLKDLAGDDLPSQFFVWTRAGESVVDKMQTYVAARVARPETWVDRAVAKLQPLYQADPANPKLAGNLKVDPERHAVMIDNLITPPRLAPIKDLDRSYLVLGLMPPSRSGTALPPGLVSQLERPDLLYYDWEITADNMAHWNIVGQASDMLRHRIPASRRPGAQWLPAATARMGESVTEATITGPKELTVKRKSTAGFTALELVLFSRWLDGEAPLRASAKAAK